MKKEIFTGIDWRITDRSAKSFNYYLNRIRRINVADADEMRDLVATINIESACAREARDRLVETNLRLVVAIAKNFYCSTLGLEDLVGEGNIGLLKAVEKYVPSDDSLFTTFASRWIAGQIINAVRRYGYFVHAPISVRRLQKAYAKFAKEFSRVHGRDATIEDFATATGRESYVLHQALTDNSDVVSIDVEDNDVADARSIENQLERAKLIEMLAKMLKGIVGRDRARLMLDLGGLRGMDYTMDELAAAHGMTRRRLAKERDAAFADIKASKKSEAVRRLLKRIVACSPPK